VALSGTSAGAITQVVCEGTPINAISLDLIEAQPNAVVTVTNLPPGVYSNRVGNVLTISGTPVNISDLTTYNYLIEVTSGTNQCTGTLSGSIQVHPTDELVLQTPGSISNMYCSGDTIAPITYSFAGGTIGANIQWTENGNPIANPLGIASQLTANSLTISGALLEDVTATTTYSYTITSSNSGVCASNTTVSGTLTLNPKPNITLIPSGGQSNQLICEGDAITDIVYELSNGGNSFSIDWNSLPNGIITQYDAAASRVTISGVVQNINSDTSFTYTLTGINQLTGCTSEIQTGTLQVSAAHELNLISGSNTATQEICEQTPLPYDIVYAFGGGATSAQVFGLNNTGLNWIINGNQVVISGTPSQDINTRLPLSYTIETLGNSCGAQSLTRTITLNPDTEMALAATSAPPNQTLCEGTPISDIQYEISEGYWAYEVSGLPTGITHSYDAASRLITITGTPSSNIISDQGYNFTVKAFNEFSCTSPELSGTINVVAGPELTNLGASNTLNQTVCVDSEIDKISFRFANSLPPSLPSLPSGLSTQITGDIIEISGKISTGGSYLFDIQASNNSCSTPVTIPIQINVQPDFTILPQFDAGYDEDLTTTVGTSRVKSIACHGERTGEIKVEMSDPAFSYLYAWTGPNDYSNTTTSNHIRNLLPGIYTVNVSAIGASTCSVSETFVIREPDPLQIITNEIIPVSCDSGADDGVISISAEGGNDDFYKQLTWFYFEEDVSCLTYTISLRDMDNDGIYDIVDADIDNDGSVDSGKVDANGDGLDDAADLDADGVIDANYSLGEVSYQNCDSGQFVNLNLISADFSSNGTLQICARPTSVTSTANLDHDNDGATALISSVNISGGVISCYSGTWVESFNLNGSSYASELKEGLYKVRVDEVEYATGRKFCYLEETFEVTKNEITFANIQVSDTYCVESSGYIDLDVNVSNVALYFYYNGTRILDQNVSVISQTFFATTYRLNILNVTDNASLEIQDEFGCGTTVDSNLLDISVEDPSFTYTSPEYERYGTISERSSVRFTLDGINSYDRIVWDFGDASSLVEGNRVTHEYQAEGTYQVVLTVYNASGCFKTSTQEIVVGKGYSLMMPNTFTPNNDNINDVIKPVFTGLKEVNFYVYNISGALIYEETVTEDTSSSTGLIVMQGWDGSNSDPNSIHYVYKIIATRLNDEIVNEQGTILILK
jgi:hypothetical protein